jgi:hypothetical protein
LSGNGGSDNQRQVWGFARIDAGFNRLRTRFGDGGLTETIGTSKGKSMRGGVVASKNVSIYQVSIGVSLLSHVFLNIFLMFVRE